jgi:hypothetical protein
VGALRKTHRRAQVLELHPNQQIANLRVVFFQDFEQPRFFAEPGLFAAHLADSNVERVAAVLARQSHMLSGSVTIVQDTDRRHRVL